MFLLSGCGPLRRGLVVFAWSVTDKRDLLKCLRILSGSWLSAYPFQLLPIPNHRLLLLNNRPLSLLFPGGSECSGFGSMVPLSCCTISGNTGSLIIGALGLFSYVFWLTAGSFDERASMSSFMPQPLFLVSFSEATKLLGEYQRFHHTGA